jgi:hypothetical protein
LLPKKTLEENVAFALQVCGEKSAKIGKIVPSVLKIVGLDDKKRRYPGEVSGGEQQRVARQEGREHQARLAEENVVEARERMFNEVKNFYSYKLNTKKPSEGFWDSIKWILERNIILGDMLNKVEDVVLVEYTSPSPGKIKRQEFRLIDQIKNKKKETTLFADTTILKNYKISNYNSLCL